MVIYVITTFRDYKKVEYGYELVFPRTIGWFCNYEDAYEVVHNNVTDICEAYAEYAIIEGYEEGLYYKPTLQELYKVDQIEKGGYYNEDLKYERIEAPEDFLMDLVR